MKYKELIEVQIEQLNFDQNNPRLPKKLFGASESNTIEWMLLDASLLDLIASIANNGFFPGEPLLVVKNSSSNTYTVIEGNRRLASCKLLIDPTLATVKSKSIQKIIEEADTKNIPEKLPVFLFEKREDILAYLGYRHVTGVKSWGALPKAKYLYELYSIDKSNLPIKEKCRTLAKKIGSRGDYVLKLLISYQLFLKMENENFFEIKNLSEESIEFSNLVDAATRFGNISKFIGIDFGSEDPLEKLDSERYIELSKWLFKRDENSRTQIGENRNIRLLNHIVNSPRALDEFRNSTNIKDAYLLTAMPDEIFSKSLSSCLRSLKNAEEVREHISKNIKENMISEFASIKTLVEVINKELYN